jgi:hypothetical protein
MVKLICQKLKKGGLQGQEWLLLGKKRKNRESERKRKKLKIS